MDTRPRPSRFARLSFALEAIVKEINRCPDDSIQDIANEQLKAWKTGLRMNHCYELHPTLDGDNWVGWL